MNAICEEATYNLVIVEPSSWEEIDAKEQRNMYGSLSTEEMAALTKGHCLEANANRGCQYSRYCTGKIKYRASDMNGVVIIFETISKKTWEPPTPIEQMEDSDQFT